MKDIGQNKKTPKNVRTLGPPTQKRSQKKNKKSENKRKSYKMKVISLYE